VWEFAASSVVKNRIILLGDAAHASSPRTGTGAYTAMVDAVSLGIALQRAPDNDLDAALQIYNSDTVRRRGQDLYQRSRSSAQYFTPPNKPTLSPSDLLNILS
jgi:2-polyprenyl-6-methoxyphenol hydroxylase-like FAD-dependent oxidoreductase